MLRTLGRSGLLFLLGAGVALDRGPAAHESGAPPDPDHLEQLANCRAGIVDRQARPEDRRRWIDTLLAFDTPEAKTLVVELLQLSENPAAQQALCEVIGERARKNPERLDSAFLEPLIELLGAETGDLRAAAAQALADFPGEQVPAKLGAFAAQDNVPLLKRLAAIDALAAKVNRREVVRELMTLLDAGVPEITTRVTAALEPAARDTLGDDPDAWRAWWERKSKLSDIAWLTDRLDMYRDRYRERAEAFETYREKTCARQEALAVRISELQRELFHGFAAEQQRARLVEWLTDPLPEVRQSALGIIRARIADEGQGPAGEVLAALLRLLNDESPAMRREVVLIVQNLNDPATVDAVLDRLEKEQDPATRHAIFKAIGKLQSEDAVPALVREIASTDSHPACVREAALALGQITNRLEETEERQEAIEALRSRYRLARDGDPALRAALVTAMAGVAPASFAPELIEAVESNDPATLRPAIRGLATIGNASKLPRLRALTTDPDPLVRRAALEAVMKLGGEDADLESVLARLNPAIEPNELVREAAWRAFREYNVDKPIADQIGSARRLRELPEFEVRYLVELLNRLAIANGDTSYTETVQTRLAEVLVDQGKCAEAAAHLRELFETQAERSEPGAFETGLRWLHAALRSGPQHNVAAVVIRLAENAGSEQHKTGIIDTVAEYLDGPGAAATPDDTRALLASLRDIRADLLGEEWGRLLDAAASRLDEGSPNSAPEPNP